MQKMVLSFGVILLGLLVGQLIKKYNKKLPVGAQVKLSSTIEVIRKFAFFVLNPLILVNSYWIIDFSNVSIFVLPVICIIVLSLNGLLGTFFSKKLQHTSEQKASMFATSTFSNLGTIGGLITFSFFGEKAFALSAMFIFFESFYNYLIAYPIVKAIGENTKNKLLSITDFLKDPSIVIYVSAVFIGSMLNISPIERPQFMTVYNDTMIPIVSFLLITAIAFKMNLGKTKSFAKEGFIVVFLKFCVAPIIGISLCYIFGINQLEGGLVTKVVAIMTMVPCGFNAIMVPTIYKADKDLANTGWLFSMFALVLVVPLEYLFFFIF